jgi:hypothetical protein
MDPWSPITGPLLSGCTSSDVVVKKPEEWSWGANLNKIQYIFCYDFSVTEYETYL